jgi:cell division transport system permease protein
MVSLAAIGIVGLIISVFAVFLCLAANVENAIGLWKREIGLVLYLKSDLTTEELNRIKIMIDSDPAVDRSRYISPSEAWEELNRKIKLGRGMPGSLGDKSLPGIIEAKLKKPFWELETGPALVARLSRLPGVDEVDYGQEWIGRANRFFRLVETILFGLCLLLAVAAIFVIGNTIRLIIMNRREEIEILNLLGASPGFIASPYLLEGLIQGLGGGVVAMILAFLAYRIGIVPLFQTFGFIGDINLSFLSINTSLGVVMAGGVTGLLGSGLSVRKYLALGS